MMINKNKIIIASAIVAMSTVGAAVAQKNFKQDADNMFAGYQYYNAADLYKKAYAKEKRKDIKAEELYKIAECYRNVHDTKQAESWYGKAIEAKYPSTKAVLYLADMMKANEKYAEAITQYNAYKALEPGDKKAEDGAKSCELAQKWKDKPSRYAVANETQVNGAASDFSPMYADKKYNELYFTSTREGATGAIVDNITGGNYSDVYTVKRDKKGKWSTATLLGIEINSAQNEGSVFLNNKVSSMYFTRCPIIKKKNMGCQILVAERKGMDWGPASVVPINVPDSIAVGHPALTPDESKLFFASDMPGGQGGKDIWMVEMDKKTKAFGAPVNLGPTINTPEDEMYPFVHDDGTLYFASAGHLGMGGLDIYKAEKSGDNFTGVSNLRFPINSAADDFGIVFEGKNERGFFTSNREGGKGDDDIYSFALPALLHVTQGVVRDVDTKAPIAGAKVKLIGSDGSTVELTTDANGVYKFDKNGTEQYVKPNVTYQIYASMDKFFNSDKMRFTTVGDEVSKTFEQSLSLKSIAKPIELPNIFYDLGKAELRPESMVSLDGLVFTLNENPGITIKLGSHTDSRGDDKSNQALSQARAQSVMDYLVSKGIEIERLTAFGFGETAPKTLGTDLVTAAGLKIPAGTALVEKYIMKIKDKADQEEAFQQNRRTDFLVLTTNFVSTKK
jgi:peptidoglycan-associated lipoprotein